MADEESFLDDDVTSGGQDTEVSQRAGFVPALLVKVLKWAAIGIAAVIFIVTVVYFTMRILNRGARPAAVPTVSEEYRATPPKYHYYDAFDEIRTRTADETAFTVIARVAIGYDDSNKNLTNELTERNKKIQDLIRSYFTQRTAAEVMPRNEEVVKHELLERINTILSSGKIRDVIFLEYNVIES